LQCGEAVHHAPAAGDGNIEIGDTTDPVLRRAIADATGGPVTFAAEEMPVAGLVPAMPGVPAVGAAPVMQRPRWKLWAWALAWAWVLVGLAAVLAVGNMAVAQYYSDRVYPGVRVGSTSVGGWTFGELHTKLPAVVARPELVAVVDGRRYDLELEQPGQVATSALEARVRQAGRDAAVPLAGWAGSWLQPVLIPEYSLNAAAVDKAVERLAAKIDRAPSDAQVLVVGTKVLVLADKPGVRLDRTAAAKAIKQAYGRASNVTLKQNRVAAAVSAGSFAAEVAAAQEIIGLNVTIAVKQASYSPKPEQLASWLVFKGPGKGVTVDRAGAAGFIEAIPGVFDRKQALDVLVAALDARRAATIVPSTRKNTAVSKLSSTRPSGPVAQYAYCVDGPAEQVAALKGAVAQTLASSWGLSGRIQFVFAEADCAFAVHIASVQSMRAFDPACESQSSCRIHNELALLDTGWTKIPSGWSSDLTAYRAELINHVVGQWLGFEHPGCGEAASPLTEPSVVLTGCSPRWYAVPAELQDTKVLAGF
jgi:Putative peptidoglycan binding domain/Protein of unknown function (DUF3152)